MAVNKSKVEKKLADVNQQITALQNNVNQEINTLNNQIANKVFYVNKLSGKIEALDVDDFSDLGYTAEEKDELLETHKANVETAQQEIQTLQQQVESLRSQGVANAQSLVGKKELYEELLDITD
tara:strand:+ start:56 stop:427 length:372 start_codon:yes stop_codon:yes gene_type:complete